MPRVERVTITERPGMLRQLGVDTGYVLFGFPLAVVSFSVILTGLSAGVGLLVVL
ncbi:MAG: Two-component system sensor kinase, partial [Mycobacterium sp.]|nr:Two-component system sensor kinase [Mycobacterium sp.]